MIHDITAPCPQAPCEIRPHCVALSGLELTETHLPQPPENQALCYIASFTGPALLFTSLWGRVFPCCSGDSIAGCWFVYLLLRHDLFLQPKLPKINCVAQGKCESVVVLLFWLLSAGIIIMNYCLSLVLTALTKHYDHKQLQDEGVYFRFQFTVHHEF